jgi:hypothetical protein
MSRIRAELDQLQENQNANTNTALNSRSSVATSAIKLPTSPTAPVLCEVNSITKVSVLDWNESRVEKWIRDVNVHPRIRDNVGVCDGKLLGELHTIMNAAPDYFYSNISSKITGDTNPPLRFKDVARFSYELRNLFKS